jgi:hypothetical protein
LALFFALFAVAFAASLASSFRLSARSVLIAACGLALGALLNLPAILSHGATIRADAFVGDFALPYQLFSSSWGASANVPIPNGREIRVDLVPLQMGVIPTGLAIAAAALVQRIKEPRARRAMIVALTSAVILAFLTLGISAPLWSVLGALVASPWQLLAFVGLALALVAGGVVECDGRLAQPAMLAFLVALPLVSVYGYLAPDFHDFGPTRPQIATLNGGEIALLDYRIVGPLRHGATLRVQLQWQALRKIDHDYTVFVHAVDEEGRTWGREDSKPVEGTLPTVKWKPGQVISDTHTIQIDVDGPREGYHLELGLYQAGATTRTLWEHGSEELTLPRLGDPPPIISEQMPIAVLP